MVCGYSRNDSISLTLGRRGEPFFLTVHVIPAFYCKTGQNKVVSVVDQNRVSILTEPTLDNPLVKIIKSNSSPLYPIKTETVPNLNCPANIRSVIFDIYGTLLISSSGDIGTAENSPLSTIFTRSLIESDIKIFSAKTGKTGLSLFYREIEMIHIKKRESGINYPEVDITEVWDKVIFHLKENNLIESIIPESKILSAAVRFETLSNPVWLMPGAVDLLDQLKNSGFILGIISNAQFYTPLTFLSLTGRTMEELGFNSDLLEYSYKRGIAKPSVDMFACLCSNLKKLNNIAPEEILYIGNDMLNDVYSAKVSGMTAALFAGDRRSLRIRKDNAEVQKIKPDLIITELDQIPGALAK